MAQPPSASPQPSPPTAAHPKTSGLAVASLVCGIGGLLTCGLSAIVGVILGIVALMKIGKTGGRMGGRGLAIAGIIVSACMIVVGVVGFLFTGMVFFRDEIKQSVTDSWQDAIGQEQGEHGDFFGGPLDRLGLPPPGLRPARSPALLQLPASLPCASP